MAFRKLRQRSRRFNNVYRSVQAYSHNFKAKHYYRKSKRYQKRARAGFLSLPVIVALIAVWYFFFKK